MRGQFERPYGERITRWGVTRRDALAIAATVAVVAVLSLAVGSAVAVTTQDDPQPCLGAPR